MLAYVERMMMKAESQWLGTSILDFSGSQMPEKLQDNIKKHTIRPV